MIVCLTAERPEPDSPMDRAFGRAKYFLFADSANGSWETAANEPSAHGAGVQAAQTVADRGASVLITGNVGPNAMKGLQAAGVRVFSASGIRVSDALQLYEEGALTEILSPTTAGHGGNL